MGKYVLFTVTVLLIQISCAQWQPASITFPQLSVNSFAFNATGFYAGANTALLNSVNYGLNWGVQSSLNIPVFALFQSGNFMYAAKSQGIRRSSDYGVTWPASDTTINWLHVTCFAQTGSYLFAGTLTDGVYRSTNYGGSWSKFNTGITSNSINCLQVIDDTVYAGTGAGAVFKTTSFGQVWAPASFGLPGPGNDVRVLYADGSIIFAGLFNGGVYRTDNGGLNWQPCGTIGVNNHTVNALTSYGGVLFAGTLNEGVYRSYDQGDQWYADNNGLGTAGIDRDIHAFGISATDMFLSCGNGIYKRNLANAVAVEKFNYNTEISLFPNPSNGAFTINIPFAGLTSSVEIYNAEGKRQSSTSFVGNTYTSEKLIPGMYFIKFKNDLQSGVKKLVVK